jgi:hypothetical protein
MFTKVSVLIPTRHRLERLGQMMMSYCETAGECSELVFRVDDDDTDTQRYLKDISDMAPCRVVVGPRKKGYASLGDFFNELYAASTGDVLMCGNDDMVFQTSGWDAKILEEANRYPDGIFDFGVETHNAANFPFATVSRSMCDRLGFFFDPRMFWGDIFWRDVTSRFDRAIRLPDIHIDHDWAGFRPDEVFLEGESTRRADHLAFHAQAVNEAVEKLK